MIIFFDWDEEEDGGQNGLANHVGIVAKVEDGYVYTIEGTELIGHKWTISPFGFAIIYRRKISQISTIKELNRLSLCC